MPGEIPDPWEWPGQMEVVIAADKEGGECRVYKGELRSCLGVVEMALKPAKVALLIVDASKVKGFVGLIRRYQSKLLVGSVAESEQRWLLGAVDVIVASLDEIRSYKGKLSDQVRALVIEKSGSELESQAKRFASSYMGFEALNKGGMEEEVAPTAAWEWYKDPEEGMMPLGPALVRALGTKSSCDRAFRARLSAFAWGRFNVAVQGWSDVALLLPGLLRARKNTDKPLILAPKRRMHQMMALLRECVAAMGIDEFFCAIATSPEELKDAALYNKVIIVDADELLPTIVPTRGKACGVLGSDCSIGLHFNQLTPEVSELVRDAKCSVVPPPGISLEGVYSFAAEASSDEEKARKLREFWGQLQGSRAKRPLVVFCNSEESVDWLADRMEQHFSSVWRLYAGGRVEPLMYKDRYPLLITNQYKRGIHDVVNFDLPTTSSDYIQRVGRVRGMPTRLVVNLGARHQLDLLQVPMDPLPTSCLDIHARFPLWLTT